MLLPRVSNVFNIEIRPAPSILGDFGRVGSVLRVILPIRRVFLGLGLLHSLGFISGVILPIRFRPTRRSDSTPAPPRIQPKMLTGSRDYIGWPWLSNVFNRYISCDKHLHDQCYPPGDGSIRNAAHPESPAREVFRVTRYDLGYRITLVAFRQVDNVDVPRLPSTAPGQQAQLYHYNHCISIEWKPGGRRLCVRLYVAGLSTPIRITTRSA